MVRIDVKARAQNGNRRKHRVRMFLKQVSVVWMETDVASSAIFWTGACFVKKQFREFEDSLGHTEEQGHANASGVVE